MSVDVYYQGRDGNRICQYVAARLFAERNGLQLIAKPPTTLFGCTHPKTGNLIHDNFPSFVLDSHVEHWTTEKALPANYVFKGWFQRADMFEKHREQIESFFVLPKVEPRKGIVAHVRLGDYQTLGWVIHPQWYASILPLVAGHRLYITDTPVGSYWGELSERTGKEIRPVMTTPRDDFNAIRAAETIIMSNSTFAFWAAFLSKAQRVYTFRPWLPAKAMSENDIRMTVFRNTVQVDGEFWKGAR